MTRSLGVSRPIRRAGLLAVAVLLALGGWLSTARPASAHNTLRSTSPADQSTVGAVPAEVVLTFDEPAVALGTEIVVTGPDGPVGDGAARLLDNTVTQSIRTGAPAGAYEVQWRVTSADGHPITGAFIFTARTAGGASRETSGEKSGGASGGGSGAASGGEGSTPAATPAAVTLTPGTPGTSSTGAGVPNWLWPVIAAVLLLAALTSAVAARRRNRR